MVRFIKLLALLVVVLALVLVGYAYFGDLSPDQQDASEPLELNAE